MGTRNFQELISGNGNSDLTEGEKKNIAAFVINNERKNQNSKYLEIGTFGGGNIKFLKENTKTTQFTGIDLFEDFVQHPDNTHISGTYSKSDVEKFIGSDRVNLIKGYSTDILPIISEKFDFIFIDGNHSYSATKKDFELVEPLLALGGQVAFHNCSAHHFPDWDFYIKADGGPWAVCQEILQLPNWKLIVDVDRLKVFRKI